MPSAATTLVWNGSADDVVAMEQGASRFFEDLRKRVIAMHGSDRNVFDFGFEPGGGHRPYFVTRPAAAWLERQLAFSKLDGGFDRGDAGDAHSGVGGKESCRDG